MSRFRKSLAGALSLAFLALAIPIALVGTGASADVFESEVGIRYRDAAGVFRGRVESTPDCESNRLVILFKARPGNDKRVGRDTTNDAGGWRIEKENANGTYYVKVVREQLGGYSGDDRCGRDRSRPIKV